MQQPQVHEEERLDSYPWESVLSGGGNGTGATPAWPQEHLDAARRWWAGAVRACTLVWVPCGGGSPFAVRSGALAPSALFARRRVPVLVVRAPTLAATHPRPVCVHVHGADEDLCACAPRLRAFAATHRTDVVALEYPGYGGYHHNSNSSQTTAAILRDLTAVVAHALVCWDGPVVLRGRQQGAVAVLHYVLAVHTPALANDRGAAALRARLAGVVADELPPVAPHLHNAAAASAADVACPVALSTPSADPAVVSATRMLALLFRRASFRWHVRCAGGDLCVDGGREEAVEEEDEDDEAREALAPIFPEAARIATVKTTPASGIAAGAGAAVAGLPELLLARVRHSDGGGNEEEEDDSNTKEEDIMEEEKLKRWLQRRGRDGWVAEGLRAWRLRSLAQVARVPLDSDAARACPGLARLIPDARDTLDLADLTWAEHKALLAGTPLLVAPAARPRAAALRAAAAAHARAWLAGGDGATPPPAPPSQTHVHTRQRSNSTALAVRPPRTSSGTAAAAAVPLARPQRPRRNTVDGGADADNAAAAVARSSSAGHGRHTLRRVKQILRSGIPG